MQHHDEPRYEFRIFGSDLEAPAKRLAEMAVEKEEAASAEAYVVTRLNIDCCVKQRDDQLDVKILDCRQGELELWVPTLRIEPPIESDLFADQVATCLGIDFDPPEVDALDWAAIRKIVENDPALAWVPVQKRRVRYTVPPGWGEIVDLEIPGATVQTIAVEAAQAEDARQLVERTGIGSHENESYPCYLQALVFG